MKSTGLRALAAMIAIAATLVPAESSAPARDCRSPRTVPGIGLACPVPGGYLVPTVDGRTLFTHGGDPIPSREPLREFVTKRKPHCASRPDAEFHMRVMYVHASDRKNRSTTFAAPIRTMVEQVNGWLHQNAKLFDRSIDMRVLCSGGKVSVKAVQVSTPLKETSFGSVANDLINLGYSNPLAKYWIYFDGRFPGAPGGTGSFANNGSPAPENRANVGSQYAITWGIRSPGIMMHENGHNLGAVATSAPRTTGAGHCIDGRDVMCYNDNGSFSSKYTGSRCDIEYYDCGFDDYFNPRPKPNSYLGTHWNIGAPANRYIAGCAYRHGLLTAPAPAEDPEVVLETIRPSVPPDVRPDPLEMFSRKHTVPRECWKRPFAASAIIQPATATVTTTNSLVDSLVDVVYSEFVPGSVQATNVDVCWYKKSTPMSCASSGRYETGTVPKGATHFRMILRGAGPAVYVFNAV